jgi:hypothetical protein
MGDGTALPTQIIFLVSEFHSEVFTQSLRGGTACERAMIFWGCPAPISQI